MKNNKKGKKKQKWRKLDDEVAFGHLHTWASIEAEDNNVKQMHFNKKFAQSKKTWKHIAYIKQKDKKNFKMNVLRKTCKQKMTQKKLNANEWAMHKPKKTQTQKKPNESFKNEHFQKTHWKWM
jgi:hypothetical protein